jgi:hypothetical protein
MCQLIPRRFPDLEPELEQPSEPEPQFDLAPDTACLQLENDRLGQGSPLRFKIEYDVMLQLIRHLPSPGARHLVVPNRRVPHQVLDHLVRIGCAAARAAADRGCIRVVRRSTHDRIARLQSECVDGFASLQCCPTSATPVAEAGGSQYISKDVPWIIDWEDRALTAKSSVTIAGAGDADGLYNRVQVSGLQAVFRKTNAPPVQGGYYGARTQHVCVHHSVRTATVS